MIININNHILVIFLSCLIVSCGFKPIHKFDESGFNMANFNVIYNNTDKVSYEVKDEINRLFSSDTNGITYNLVLNIKEENIPLIINTNGTVAKFQTEISISFKVTNSQDELIIDDSVKGYAQYDVQASEINNDETKKQMIRSATNEAMSLITSKIQSRIVSLNDN